MRGNLAHRKDNNHKSITEKLIALNISFCNTHMVGNGFPDIVIGICNYNLLVEVKSGKGKLTKKELGFSDTWQGYIIIAYNINDIFDGIKLFAKTIDDKILYQTIMELSKKL